MYHGFSNHSKRNLGSFMFCLLKDLFFLCFFGVHSSRMEAELLSTTIR